MQGESRRKEAIKRVFDTVAAAYGLGACRFFHESGEVEFSDRTAPTDWSDC